MKKHVGLIIMLVVVAVFVALTVPMWTATAGMSMPASGWGAVILMIFFCFLVGGGLMFLIFYSARRGYDDDAHLGTTRGREPPPPAQDL